MKRCPKCERFGVEHDPFTKVERCLWDDCRWVNVNGRDITKHDFKIKYKKFIKVIESVVDGEEK